MLQVRFQSPSHITHFCQFSPFYTVKLAFLSRLGGFISGGIRNWLYDGSTAVQLCENWQSFDTSWFGVSHNDNVCHSAGCQLLWPNIIMRDDATAQYRLWRTHVRKCLIRFRNVWICLDKFKWVWISLDKFR